MGIESNMKRDIEFVNYAEWVEGWDPIGAGDLIGSLLEWSRVYSPADEPVEKAVARFKTSEVWFEFFPDEQLKSQV